MSEQINKAGELIDHIIAAVQQHGATPNTELRVRIGRVGPEYTIRGLRGVQDGRGFQLLIETQALPETYG